MLIGLTFLALCLSAAEALGELEIPGTRILAESLQIAGWVAMWHSMEVYLYGWWPLRRTGRIHRKLSTILVDTNRPKVEGRSSAGKSSSDTGAQSCAQLE